MLADSIPIALIQIAAFFLLLFGGLLQAFLIKAPLPTIGVFGLILVIDWAWSKILPNWK